MELSREDHEAVSSAIRSAEQHTCGQIVCVLSHASSDYAFVPLLLASVLALLSPWPLIHFTPWSVERIFLVQIAVFIVAGLVFSWPPLHIALVPRPMRRALAHRAALEQFVVRRIASTKNRCGILIFVSLAEHYARIIADEGIAAKVKPRRVAGGNRCPDGSHATTAGSHKASSPPSTAAAQCSPRMRRRTARRMSCRIASTSFSTPASGALRAASQRLGEEIAHQHVGLAAQLFVVARGS